LAFVGCGKESGKDNKGGSLGGSGKNKVVQISELRVINNQLSYLMMLNAPNKIEKADLVNKKTSVLGSVVTSYHKEDGKITAEKFDELFERFDLDRIYPDDYIEERKKSLVKGSYVIIEAYLPYQIANSSDLRIVIKGKLNGERAEFIQDINP
jgi:hypothetical protein